MIAKCFCQHCGGGMEFDADGFQSDTRIECPHCQMETILYIPPTQAEPNQDIYPMSKSEFFKMFIGYYNGIGYSFYVPGGQFVVPKQMSLTKQNVMKAIAGVAMSLAINPGFGTLTSLFSFNLSAEDKESLVKDLETMQHHCDLVGIKISGIGPANLILCIDADEISNESLIGRFAVIQEQAHKFIKYSPAGVFGHKTGVHAWGCVVFSAHIRAKDFADNAANKCKHPVSWKLVYTQPWVYDLEQHSEKIKAKFSSKK